MKTLTEIEDLVRRANNHEAIVHIEAVVTSLVQACVKLEKRVEKLERRLEVSDRAKFLRKR